MAIFQSSISARDIKKVVLNGMDVTVGHTGQRVIINFLQYKLKAGQPVTVKFVHAAGSTIKLLDPKGID